MLVADMIDRRPHKLFPVQEGTPLAEVWDLMKNHDLDEVPVITRTGQLAGILTKSALRGVRSGQAIQMARLFPQAVVSGKENAVCLLERFDRTDRAYLLVQDAGRGLLGAVSREGEKLSILRRSLELIPVPEIFDALQDAIIIIDDTGTIVYTNHAYGKIIGVLPGKIFGRKMQSVEPNSRCLAVLQGADPLINQRIRIQSIGLEVLATITPVWHAGRKVGVISVFRDISETITLSQELQRMQTLASYLQDQLDRKANLPPQFHSIIGVNEAFRDALALAARVADSNASIMIRGENGVGKELLANAIHRASRRRDRPMIRVNCAAIPEPLLESELFGYEEGAFTGARRGGKIGKFELAHRGTLFLDEVGDMTPAMQAKLLRAVQEKEIERVGGTSPIRVDVRIISATNKNLEDMVRREVFREDLFYRLNVVSIQIPPLRERPEDIPLLAEHFVRFYGQQQGKGDLNLSDDVLRLLQRYHWPGNIRELQNVIQHAVILCSGRTIGREDLPRYLRKGDSPRVAAGEEELCLERLVAQVEKEAIERALRTCRNNKTRAMKMLGISRKCFYEKLKKYQLVLEQ